MPVRLSVITTDGRVAGQRNCRGHYDQVIEPANERFVSDHRHSVPNMPDNRELAALIWLGVALLWVLSHKTVRSPMGDVVRTFFKAVIFLPLLLMFAHIGVEVWLGFKLHLWHPDLMKPTLIWAVGSAAVLYFNSPTAAKDPRFFRSTVAGTVGVAVFLEFFMNLRVMALAAELVLQPVVALFALMSVVAGAKPEHRPVKLLSEAILAVVGFALFGFTIWHLYTTWDQLDKRQLMMEFILPIWLTVGVLPFIYLLSVYITYDSALRGINWATRDRRARWRARLALISKFHVRHRQLHGFTWMWAKRLTSATDVRAAREVISEYERSRHEAEQAIADAQERLKRYAGSNQTDEHGRRLDRREFKETMDALAGDLPDGVVHQRWGNIPSRPGDTLRR